MNRSGSLPHFGFIFLFVVGFGIFEPAPTFLKQKKNISVVSRRKISVVVSKVIREVRFFPLPPPPDPRRAGSVPNNTGQAADVYA